MKEILYIVLGGLMIFGVLIVIARAYTDDWLEAFLYLILGLAVIGILWSGVVLIQTGMSSL